MIKVIRNTKSNRVVALSVNGKQFSISKDLGHAISLEEVANNKEVKELRAKAKSIERTIKQKSYISDAPSLKLKVSFDELNRIVSNRTSIEFKENLDNPFKEKFFEILEDFILAVNIAQYHKSQEYKESVIKSGIIEVKKTA